MHIVIVIVQRLGRCSRRRIQCCAGLHVCGDPRAAANGKSSCTPTRRCPLIHPRIRAAPMLSRMRDSFRCSSSKFDSEELCLLTMRPKLAASISSLSSSSLAYSTVEGNSHHKRRAAMQMSGPSRSQLQRAARVTLLPAYRRRLRSTRSGAFAGRASAPRHTSARVRRQCQWHNEW